MRNFDQYRSKTKTYDLSSINNVNIKVVNRALRDIKEEEGRKERLEENGNGKYVNLGSDYRLLFHTAFGSEELKRLRVIVLEIIGNEADIYSLKSMSYGLLGEFGSRKLSAYIESQGISDDKVKLIGYNDYIYLGVTSSGILSKNSNYLEGYQKAEVDYLLSIVNPSDISRDEVVMALQSRLEELSKKSSKR